ncbi:MAG: GNAT family N-acetyltransferase [Roseivirga sp.]
MNDLTIKKLEAHDLDTFKEVIRLFEQVFEMDNFRLPDNEHLQRLLHKEDFLVFTAQFEGKVVGALTAYVLEQYYAVRPLVYIYDLAVDSSVQRKGIGKKLIAAINHYCTQQGFEEVFVQADKDEDHAVNFYRSTRPTAEEEVVHFYYTLNGDSQA